MEYCFNITLSLFLECQDKSYCETMITLPSNDACPRDGKYVQVMYVYNGKLAFHMNMIYGKYVTLLHEMGI